MGASTVSIMVPTYNQAGFVQRAVESALAQNWPELEVIAVDDASTDGTVEALREYQSNPRFRLFRNKRNLGRIGNYRASLKGHARGDWVLNLDGDDYLCDDGFVSKAMDIASRDPRVALVIGRLQELHQPSSELILCEANKDQPATRDGRDVFLSLPRDEVLPFHAATIYRRADALALDFYRCDIESSDWESLFRLMLGNWVGFVPDVVAVWRLHGANTVSRARAKDRIANLEVVLGPYEHACAGGFFESGVIDDWRHKMLLKRAQMDAFALFSSGDRAGYRAYLRRMRKLDAEVASYVRSRYSVAKRLKRFLKAGSKQREAP